jgi:hypothetical protein
MKQRVVLLRFGMTKGRAAMASGFGIDQDRHFLNLNMEKRRSVPEGRLNLAQDGSPGLDLKRRLVPQGRLKIGRDAILNNFQPSLRDLIMFHDVPRTSVLG